MYTGTITELFHDKEYGSIQSSDGEKVHFNKHCLWNVQFSELKEGQEVEFETQMSNKGFLGFHIRLCVVNQ